MNRKNLIIIATAILLSNVLTGAFFNAYYLQIPWVITFRPMVVSRAKKAEPKIKVMTPKVAEVAKTEKYSLEYENAYDTVHFNESNRGNDKSGLNGDCIKLGMINEIGYAPGQGICFKDRQDQKDTFMLWLKNRITHVKTPYCDTVRECILFYTNSAYTI